MEPILSTIRFLVAKHYHKMVKVWMLCSVKCAQFLLEIIFQIHELRKK